jgi:dTDP-glucose 4,6-dehydratase
MKIVVTGALGFIGRNLYDYLVNKGFKVLALDLQIKDFDDYVRADVTNFYELWKIFKENKDIEFIIHLAGEVGRILGEEYPQKMIYVNSIGTLNIIQLALEYKAKLIYFSTSEIYGKKFDEKIVEEEDAYNISPFMLTNIYSISKFFGEAIVNHYVKNYGLMAVGVRPFMIYGPGVYPNKYKSAIDQFIYNALNNKPLIVHKDSLRAWCYIDDFIEGIYLILTKHIFKDKLYEVYNIGSQEYISTEELAIKILNLLNKSLDLIKLIDLPSRFISKQKKFSMDKIISLGYKPKVSLEQGLLKVIEWYKSILNYNEVK